MKETKGSYCYVLNRNTKDSQVFHGDTLNKAKEKGLEYFYKEDEPFYRFTKIPFPYLFYVSDNYIVYASYARLIENDIPYMIKLSDYDKEVKGAMNLFTEVFDRQFVFDRSAERPTKKKTQREKKLIKREREIEKNKRKDTDAYF